MYSPLGGDGVWRLGDDLRAAAEPLDVVALRPDSVDSAGSSLVVELVEVVEGSVSTGRGHTIRCG
jgi:hypothetical protein